MGTPIDPRKSQPADRWQARSLKRFGRTGQSLGYLMYWSDHVLISPYSSLLCILLGRPCIGMPHIHHYPRYWPLQSMVVRHNYHFLVGNVVEKSALITVHKVLSLVAMIGLTMSLLSSSSCFGWTVGMQDIWMACTCTDEGIDLLTGQGPLSMTRWIVIKAESEPRRVFLIHLYAYLQYIHIVSYSIVRCSHLIFLN